jgi:hypothetical protein
MCTKYYRYRDNGTGEFLRMQSDGSLYLDGNVYDAFCAHNAKNVERRALRQFGRRFQKERIAAESFLPKSDFKSMTTH